MTKVPVTLSCLIEMGKLTKCLLFFSIIFAATEVNADARTKNRKFSKENDREKTNGINARTMNSRSALGRYNKTAFSETSWS